MQYNRQNSLLKNSYLRPQSAITRRKYLRNLFLIGSPPTRRRENKKILLLAALSLLSERYFCNVRKFSGLCRGYLSNGQGAWGDNTPPPLPLPSLPPSPEVFQHCLSRLPRENNRLRGTPDLALFFPTPSPETFVLPANAKLLVSPRPHLNGG